MHALSASTSDIDLRDRSGADALPTTIWTLWLQGWDESPEVPQRCLDLWRAHHRAWEIVPLTFADLAGLLTASEIAVLRRLSPNHQSDLVRLAVLARHGGVWVDATTAPTRPIDEWLEPLTPECGVFAFSNPGPDRVAASWFLASRCGSPTIAATLDRFLRVVETSGDRSPSSVQRRIARLLEVPSRRSATTASLRTAPLVARALSHVPYYALHYALNAAVRNPISAAGREWRARQVVSADASHTVARLGMAAPADASAIEALDRCRAPVLKLSWKHPLKTDRGEPTVIAYTLEREERRLRGDI